MSAESPEQKAQAAAQELEADAAQDPDQQGELLLEAAVQWEQAGQADRAVATLQRVLALGGEDAAYARFQLAERCFERGHEEQAWTHLQALEQAAPTAMRGPAEPVAELLEERGDHAAALTWFDRAVTDEAIAAILADTDSVSMATAIPLFGRQRCRRALNLPTDAGDWAADIAEGRRREFAAELQHNSASHASLSATGAAWPARHTPMLVWQRADYADITQRWPQALPADHEGYYRRVEAQLRERQRNHPACTIILTPASAEEFTAYLTRTGADPAEPATHDAYAQHTHPHQPMTWPPGRNQPCWCGSGHKYKKCCGNPTAPSTPHD